MEDETNTSHQNETLHVTASTSAGRPRSRYLSKEEASMKTTVPRKSSEKSHSTTVSLHTAVELQVFKNFVKNYAVSRECKECMQICNQTPVEYYCQNGLHLLLVFYFVFSAT